MKMCFCIILEKRQVVIMLRFEIKKILSKTINKIVLLSLIAVTLTAAILSIRDVYFIENNGSKIIGFSAHNQLEESKNQYKGSLDSKLLGQVIKDNQEINTTQASEDDGYRKKQGLSDIRELLTVAFSKIGQYDYYIVDTLSVEDSEFFYSNRISNLKEYLNSEDAKNSFSEEEKQFLITQYEELKTPFYYEYADGWKAILDAQYLPTLMTIIVILIGFLVAGIFSDEFQYKADAIFFSTKLGRNRAVFSKIGAGFVVTTGMYWFSMLLYSIIVLTVLGISGSNCPIQTISYSYWSLYNITYLQAYFFIMLGGYIGTLFILAAAMLVSVKCRSTIIASVVPFVLACIPMFLGRVPIFSRFSYFTPDQLLSIGKSMRDFSLVQIGNNVFGSISFIILIYTSLYLIFVPLTYRAYKKIQLK